MPQKRSLFRSRICCLLPALALAFGAASQVLAANTPTTPNSGTILNSIEQKQPPTQQKNNVSIDVTEQQSATTQSAPQTAEGPRMKVSGFRITGQSIYSEEILQGLVKDVVGKELSLVELKDVASRIAKYFRDHGYVVASAYIPAQAIEGGIVKIAVMPGKYSGVEIRNHSKLQDSVAAQFLSNIKNGDCVEQKKLERTLLLLSDTAGVSIKTVLAPGKEVGTTELVIDINDADKFFGDFSINNYGNRYTGSNSSNLALTFNNVGGLGDMFNLGYSYAGEGMNNYNINYLAPLGGQGWRLGVNYSRLNYTLEDEYAPLLAHGLTKTFGVYGQYSIVRSRGFNLYGQVGVYSRRLVDDIDLYDSSNQRKTKFVSFGLSGDSRDGYGVNSFALNVEKGRLDFTGGQDIFGYSWANDDAQGAQTAGSYTKALLNFNRMQSLNDRLNLYLSFTGQLASKNLDSSEKLYLGGGNGVRAYAQGEAPGDEGYLLTGELRYNLPTPNFQLAAFIDAGHVGGNKDSWTGGDQSRTLSGAGLGLIWNNQNKYHIRIDYAWKLSSSPDTTETPDKHGRWWLTGAMHF